MAHEQRMDGLCVRRDAETLEPDLRREERQRRRHVPRTRRPGTRARAVPRYEPHATTMRSAAAAASARWPSEPEPITSTPRVARDDEVPGVTGQGSNRTANPLHDSLLPSPDRHLPNAEPHAPRAAGLTATWPAEVDAECHAKQPRPPARRPDDHAARGSERIPRPPAS